MACGPCCPGGPGEAGSPRLDTCTVSGIREMAGDTEVKETGFLQELMAQQMRVWTEDVNKKMMGTQTPLLNPD